MVHVKRPKPGRKSRGMPYMYSAVHVLHVHVHVDQGLDCTAASADTLYGLHVGSCKSGKKCKLGVGVQPKQIRGQCMYVTSSPFRIFLPNTQCSQHGTYVNLHFIVQRRLLGARVYFTKRKGKDMIDLTCLVTSVRFVIVLLQEDVCVAE